MLYEAIEYLLNYFLFLDIFRQLGINNDFLILLLLLLHQHHQFGSTKFQTYLFLPATYYAYRIMIANSIYHHIRRVDTIQRCVISNFVKNKKKTKKQKLEFCFPENIEKRDGFFKHNFDIFCLKMSTLRFLHFFFCRNDIITSLIIISSLQFVCMSTFFLFVC